MPMNDARIADCPLCHSADEPCLWQDAQLRVIRVSEPGYPGYCRVIWQRHVPDMSALTPQQARHCFETVLAVERVLRRLLSPDRVNLAALGNKVAHLHWHVVARFADDPHFPEAVWGAPLRAPVARAPLATGTLIAALAAELGPASCQTSLA